MESSSLASAGWFGESSIRVKYGRAELSKSDRLVNRGKRSSFSYHVRLVNSIRTGQASILLGSSEEEKNTNNRHNQLDQAR